MGPPIPVEMEQHAPAWHAVLHSMNPEAYLIDSNVQIVSKSDGGGGTITCRSLSFATEYRAAHGEY